MPPFTFSAFVFLFSLALLFVPILFVSSPIIGNSSNSKLTVNVILSRPLLTYALCTQSSSIILSLRSAGGDSARYADLYHFCGASDFRLIGSFWDPISFLLCFFSSLLSNSSFFLFLHFYICLSCLFTLPLFINRLSPVLNLSFFKYFPSICAFTVVLGFFTSPIRQAGASALIAFGILSSSFPLMFLSIFLHWSSPIIILLYYIFTLDVSDSFLSLFKYKLLPYRLFGFILVGTSIFLCLLLLPDVLVRIFYYLSILPKLFSGFLASQQLGSISIVKFFLLIFASLYGSSLLSRISLPTAHRNFIIFSLVLYPFSEFARISLSGIILFSIYLASNPSAINVKPLNLIFLFIFILVLFKSVNAFNVDYTNEQAGWIAPTIYRGYYNAYSLSEFYVNFAP